MRCLLRTAEGIALGRETMSDGVRLVRIERDGDTYVARNETGVAWTVEIRLDTPAARSRLDRKNPQ